MPIILLFRHFARAVLPEQGDAVVGAGNQSVAGAGVESADPRRQGGLIVRIAGAGAEKQRPWHRRCAVADTGGAAEIGRTGVGLILLWTSRFWPVSPYNSGWMLLLSYCLPAAAVARVRYVGSALRQLRNNLNRRRGSRRITAAQTRCG